MSTTKPDRRLAAILAADVAGYSRMMENDEVGTLNNLNFLHKQTVHPAITEHKGRIVKLMGDGLLAEFPSAVEAVECAIAIQTSILSGHSKVAEEERVWLRIGINLGDIISEGADIFGEGVNVAARLEGVADPGNIAISEAVRSAIGNKITANFEFKGRQKLKNVAEPVAVYQIGEDRASQTHASHIHLNEKPSILVLPLKNLTNDGGQEYFCDGLSEDLITRLSQFRDIFVIAGHTSFSFKNSLESVTEISDKLGVKYVLEGGVQTATNQIRVSIRLVDAETGNQIWSERYDRKLDDVFEVQDDISGKIVSTLASGYGGRLRKAWQEKTRRASPTSLKAFDYFLKGLETVDKFTKDDNKTGRELMEKAVEIDPGFAKAHAKVAWCHFLDAVEGWSRDFDRSINLGFEWAKRSIDIDDDEAWGHWAMAGGYVYVNQHDEMEAEFEHALRLNPNDADVMTDYGLFLSYAGKSAEGVIWAENAIRLNPHHPEWYLTQLVQIHFDLRGYPDAIAVSKRVKTIETTVFWLYVAASYSALGDKKNGKACLAHALRLDPEATVAKWKNLAFYKDKLDEYHFTENLRNLGLG